MFGFFKKSKGSAVDGFAKRRPIATTMLCLGALGLSLGGVTTGLVYGLKKDDDAFTNDFVAADPVGEIWNGSSFDKANLQKLFDQISGQSNVGFGTLRSMGNATTTAADMTTNNGGKEIVVTLGDLKWTPTYLSKDNQGNTILTLWLTNSSQLSGENITSSTTFNANGQSTWSSRWNKNAPEYTYPSNMYGTSYMRSVTLNNGGKYSKSDSSSPSSDAGVYTETAIQDSASVFAKFTMKSVSDLPNYIVTPKDVQWQEYGQNTKDHFSSDFSYSCPNENWSPFIPDEDTYQGTTYKFYKNSSNVYYNYASKGDDNTAWQNDKLWLPSLTETGYSDSKIGLWNTSTTQRQNSTYSWLRSGDYIHAGSACILDPSGADYNSISVGYSRGVRPALHLSLNSAALSAAIEVPPLTWLDYAADKFANETDDGTIDGSTEETAYEIATAEQLALLAKRVNDPSTHDDYASKFYKQTADIRLGGHDWQPIGTDSSSFTGHYNGNGYKIEGITINSTDSSAAIGLFCYATGATIENVNIVGGSITGTAAYVGCVVGKCENTNILNCKSNVNMEILNGLSIRMGGIVGDFTCAGDFTISGCYYSGKISSDIAASYLGGIAGMLQLGNMTNCVFAGVVKGTTIVGGLAGGCAGADGPVTISGCITKGTIIGIGGYNTPLVVGSFCGAGNNISIEDCASYSYIYADGSEGIGMLLVADFVGAAEGSITGCSFSGTCNTDDIAPFVANGTATITASYAWLNNDIKYYSDTDSDWVEHYGLAGSMNDGLPMQRSIFSVVYGSTATTEEILAVFSEQNGWKKYEAA